jgi:hypothetical protein
MNGWTNIDATHLLMSKPISKVEWSLVIQANYRLSEQSKLIVLQYYFFVTICIYEVQPFAYRRLHNNKPLAIK